MDEKQTPLYDRHVALGGRMVPFAGFIMPLQYSGIVKEHEAVRSHAGLFDISHMGEFSVFGTEVIPGLNNNLSGDFSKMKPGQIKYTLLLDHHGCVMDDLLVFCEEPDRKYMLVVNASNIGKDFIKLVYRFQQNHVGWRNTKASLGSIIDVSSYTAAIALQGPHAQALLSKLLGGAALPSKYYTFHPSVTYNGGTVLVSRNGYTGEDGFELYGGADVITALWDALIAEGAVPCGLGARDTLRFEASMPLYGHELDEDTTPAEAGLAKFVKTPSEGQELHYKTPSAEPRRRRVGLRLEGKAIARQGCAILQDGAAVGAVTSGMFCPTLGAAYAMGYVPVDSAGPYAIDIRGKQTPAEVVAMPFYKR